ncbi:hypothetical protein [Arenimonas terrae]|uniref:Uncharacterized protein n=1 Tax=Arenimonas terrae TaxID=2546226 RepID=A0A5C4RNT4_9GAMM|nr:hypothetical protein [Arenimonas terrae]TNJ32916.1 hypothetical protein E1B00_14490 [Arenimonas terrae]
MKLPFEKEQTKITGLDSTIRYFLVASFAASILPTSFLSTVGTSYAGRHLLPLFETIAAASHSPALYRGFFGSLTVLALFALPASFYAVGREQAERAQRSPTAGWVLAAVCALLAWWVLGIEVQYTAREGRAGAFQFLLANRVGMTLIGAPLATGLYALVAVATAPFALMMRDLIRAK